MSIHGTRSSTPRASETLQDQKTRAELEKLRAERKKLDDESQRAEDEAAKSKTRGARSMRVLALVDSALRPILPIVVVVVGLWQFNSQQRMTLKEQDQKSDQDREVRLAELKKAYWSEQLKVFQETTKFAAQVASAKNLNDVRQQVLDFRTKYWGEMSIFESPEVQTSMEEFNLGLQHWEKEPDNRPKRMGRLSWELTHCMRKALEQTWSPPGAPILGNLCPYKCDGWSCTHMPDQ